MKEKKKCKIKRTFFFESIFIFSRSAIWPFAMDIQYTRSHNKENYVLQLTNFPISSSLPDHFWLHCISKYWTKKNFCQSTHSAAQLWIWSGPIVYWNQHNPTCRGVGLGQPTKRIFATSIWWSSNSQRFRKRF